PSPSLSSMASFSPVEAPEGTSAEPVVPSSRRTLASTVGLPRESNTSAAVILLIRMFISYNGSKVLLRSRTRRPVIPYPQETPAPRRLRSKCVRFVRQRLLAQPLTPNHRLRR